jgi:DNA-binding NarL/FixJ family response regulator
MNRVWRIDHDHFHSKCLREPRTRGLFASAILLCEKSAHTTEVLRADLEREIGWRVLHAESLREASRYASTLRNRLRVVIVTTGRNSGETQHFIRQLRSASFANDVECPRILVLSLVVQGPEVAVAFEKLGAHYLLRAYSEQIVQFVKKFQWQGRAEKSLPTIIVRRFRGHVSQVAVQWSCLESQVEAGPRLRELAEYLAVHARTEHTTEMIADELGICRQSVKEYLLRLRRAFNQACEVASIGATGERVFWTRKISGGYVHGISANVVIEDIDEFSHRSLDDLAQPLHSGTR